MSELRLSISKTNYNTAYSSAEIQVMPSNDLIRVKFSVPPTTYTNFQKGQKVRLVKNEPLNSDWNGEYYINSVDNTGPYTVLYLIFRSGDAFIITPPTADLTGNIYTHEYDWLFLDGILNSGELKIQREDGAIFQRKKLSKDLTLVREAFNFVNDLRKICYPYLFYFRIEKKCGKVWREEYIGAFSINDNTSWDLTTCTLKAKPYTYDMYWTYYQYLKKDINIMECNPNSRHRGFIDTDTIAGGDIMGKRFIKIGELLEFFSQKNMPNVQSVSSNFFNYNTTGYSYPAGVDIRDVSNVMIQSMSDALHPNATTPCTICNYSFGKFLDNLRIMFDVYWDVVDGVLIIEHWYYFYGSTGLDITDKVINPKNEFKFDEEKLVRKEVFKFEQGEYLDDLESAIIYNSELFNNQKEGGGEQKEYSVDGVCVDFNWAYHYRLNLNKFNETYDYTRTPSEQGIMICPFDNTLITSGVVGPHPPYPYYLPPGFATSPLTLTWNYLISKFKRYNRPDLIGYYYQGKNNENRIAFQTPYNKTKKVFLSKQKTIIREDVIARYCCEDAEFNINDIMTTEWGEAEVVEAELNLYKDTLKLKLIFQSPC